MRPSARIITASLLVVLLQTVVLTGCNFFKSAEEAMHGIGEIGKKVGGEGGEKGGAKPANPSATHEGPLIDNKVVALRVQAALKKEGAEFDKVTVDATKNEVVLTGTVATSKARERAEEIARKEEHGIKLKNELKVGH
ncbi:BON domain-containing protein [Geomonas sp.]|uniref:BON domain-containing protein n=1 Tax=Geomonas sp. TaxID=2651584 RepID=UPI002B46CE9F|nr:BON domain-containing protein [Geomonas sp.]HJV33994.1 BON domain-containing protein [Geomonas sp.]